jgi:hypothetical protein
MDAQEVYESFSNGDEDERKILGEEVSSINLQLRPLYFNLKNIILL